MKLSKYLDTVKPDWKNECAELKLKGYSCNQICETLLDKYFVDLVIWANTAKNPCDQKIEANELETKFFNTIRWAVRKTTKQIKPKEDQKTKKVVVIENLIPNEIESKWDGCETIKIGVLTDTHIGSKYWQPTFLKECYENMEANGITDVYHAGDISDGLKMRPGHEYELYEITADDMVNDIVKNYPKIDGITTHFITGNHDASIYKHIGYDIGLSIADKRKDMDYLGRDSARVYLTPNCIMELRHPWDGTAYALSYKPQKMLDALDPDTKPNIMVIGHYHKAEYLFYRNVHCIQAGCFQGQTPFTRGKGISVHTGYWIITIRVDENGTIKSFAPEFHPLYKCIKDDYKNII